MRFPAVAVVATVAASQAGSVAAFVPTSSVGTRQTFSVAQPIMAKKSDYDLGDLGDLKAYVPPPEPEPKKKEAKKEKAPKAEKPAKVEKPKPKSKKELRMEAEAAAAAEAKAKAEAEAAEAAKKAKKVKAPKAAPKPKAAPVEKAPADSDPNAGPIGVAVGAAPLVAAPFIALTAARGTLQRTKARRDKIQEEIDAFEAAQAKKKVQADVDGATLTKALGLLGGAGAALGLIPAAPFSNIEAPPAAPKAAIQKIAKASKVKESETKAPSVISAPTKKAVKKTTKKVAKGAYDLDLEERVVEEEAVAAEDAASAKLAAEKAAKAKAEAKAAERAAKEKVCW